MSKPLDIRPLPKNMLQLGVPIRHAIYDAQGHLLLQAGVILQTQSQLEKLYERGLYLNSESLKVVRPKGDATKVKDATTVKDATVENEKIQAPEDQPQLAIRNIKLGENLQIKPLADETGGAHYFVKYIGGLEKKSLICSLPSVDDKIVYLKENTGLSIRVFSGKNVYTFNTIVEVIYSRPYPHMHLKYPREVSTKKLRKNQRISANIIATIANKSSGTYKGTKVSGRITNLSMGGVMLEAASISGDTGDLIECSFKLNLDGHESVFALQGSIRNVLEIASEDGGKLYQYGVQFSEIAFQEKIILEIYILQTITGEKMDDL